MVGIGLVCVQLQDLAAGSISKAKGKGRIILTPERVKSKMGLNAA